MSLPGSAPWCMIRARSFIPVPEDRVVHLVSRPEGSLEDFDGLGVTQVEVRPDPCPGRVVPGQRPGSHPARDTQHAGHLAPVKVRCWRVLQLFPELGFVQFLESQCIHRRRPSIGYESLVLRTGHRCPPAPVTRALRLASSARSPPGSCGRRVRRSRRRPRPSRPPAWPGPLSVSRRATPSLCRGVSRSRSRLVS